MTPWWIRAVLLYLAVQALRARLPEPMPEEIRARVRDLVVATDPRRMCARELRQLPGVGIKLAVAIARRRAAPRSSAPLDWEDVPGIGPIRASRIRAWCRARGVEPDPLRPERRSRKEWSESYALPVNVARYIACLLASTLLGCGDGAGRPNLAAESVPLTRDPRLEVRTIALQGGALHALEAGPPEGALVLLLHGARFTSQTWKELGTLERLARAKYRAVALDWPGHGATPRWGDEPDASALIDSVCDELGAGRIGLIGPSMGGRYALEFLEDSAARVAAFVGIAPAGAGEFAPEVWATPTLLLWGERDGIVPPESGRALAERLRGARLEVLAGASHPCYLDESDRFHALLLEFLAANMPPPSGEGR